MDIDEFLDREFSEVLKAAPAVGQHEINAQAEFPLESAPVFESIKNNLSRGSLESAEKSYAHLWHLLMQQKLKWNKELYEHLLSSSRQFSMALASAYNDLKRKMSSIYELIIKARAALKEGRKDIAFKIYSEISQVNDSIPSLFFEEKKAVQEHIAEFHKELRSATDNELIKRVYEMINEMNQLIGRIHSSIKSNDIQSSIADYNKCIEIHNQIPEGFLMHKNSAGLSLLEIYKSLSIYTEMSSLQKHLMPK